MAYVKLNREKFEKFLQACGFTKTVYGHEVVYVRRNHHYSSVLVKVWTSLPASGGDVRDAGEDAIRISVAYESDIAYQGKTSFGIHKGKKVLRTGTEEAIIDRVYERMREAYQASNEWISRHWANLPRSR